MVKMYASRWLYVMIRRLEHRGSIMRCGISTETYCLTLRRWEMLMLLKSLANCRYCSPVISVLRNSARFKFHFTSLTWIPQVEFQPGQSAKRTISFEQWCFSALFFLLLFSNCTLSVVLTVAAEDVNENVQSMLAQLPCSARHFSPSVKLVRYVCHGQMLAVG